MVPGASQIFEFYYFAMGTLTTVCVFLGDSESSLVVQYMRLPYRLHLLRLGYFVSVANNMKDCVKLDTDFKMKLNLCSSVIIEFLISD